MTQRSFASGSRQAPDPHDQFLEKIGYYRKHTGRDPSNLFRVISEQLYDTQRYHGFLREECVQYMRRNRKQWSIFVIGDFDNYLMDLSKPNTFGSVIELRALAALFRRNIFLFESYDSINCSIGKYLDYNPDFTKDFSIFFCPDHYFDTVYQSDYMENLAFCQALIYEILYRRVFKLPDINYAVERMLHDPGNDSTNIVDDPTGELCGEFHDFGEVRQFYYDLPERTNCILTDKNLCHFHNPNFKDFVASVKREEKMKSNQDTTKSRTLQSMLHCSNLSCVCQLLNAQITPFPYKVAKSLDPYIYRNVDFDVWAEIRREQRFKRWGWDRSVLRVGGRCFVKLHKSQDHLYHGYIQDYTENGSCEVYIEELGENRRVPYFHIHPQKFMRKSYAKYHQNGEKRDEDNKKGRDLIEYTKMGEMIPCPVEVVAMPVMMTGNQGGGKEDDNKEKKNSNNNEKEQKLEEDVKYEEIKPVIMEDEYGYCQELVYGDSCFYGYDSTSGMYMMPHYGVPVNPYYPNYYIPPAPVPIYSVPPPPPLLSIAPPPNSGPLSPNTANSNGMCRDPSGFPVEINFNAQPSTLPNGGDLPLFDISTVQFFYNAGIEYLACLRENYGISQAIAGLCERQGLPVPNIPIDFDDNRGRLCPPTLLPDTKVDSEVLNRKQENYQATGGNKSHQSGGNRQNRSNRKEHNNKGPKKYSARNHNNNQSGEMNNLSKGNSHQRNSAERGRKQENFTFNPNIVDEFPEMRDLHDQSVYGMNQSYPIYSNNFSGDVEQSAVSMMQPFGGSSVPYFGNQGYSGPFYSLMPPTSAAAVSSPINVPMAMTQDMGIMPPSPQFTYGPPPPLMRSSLGNGSTGEGGGGSNSAETSPGVGEVNGGSKVNDGMSPYCVIPPPAPFQYQQPPPPLMSVPPPSIRPTTNNWFHISPRAPAPPGPVTTYNNGANIPTGMYSTNTNDTSF